MECPKCGEKVQLDKVECPKCGVIYVKAFAKIAKIPSSQPEHNSSIDEKADTSETKELKMKYLSFKFAAPIALVFIFAAIFVLKYQSSSEIKFTNIAEVGNYSHSSSQKETKHSNNVSAIFLDFEGKSEIRGNVVWEYNEYVGLKSDVNARVHLLRRSKDRNRYLDPSDVVFVDKTNKEKGIYYTTVNMQGEYVISNLPDGIYDLVITSSATTRDINVEYSDAIDYMGESEKYSALSRTYSESQVSDVNEKIQNLQLSIKYSRLAGIYRDFDLFKKAIIEPHFGSQSDPHFIIYSLAESNKFKVFSEINLKDGVIVEKNVNFGNTFI